MPRIISRVLFTLSLFLTAASFPSPAAGQDAPALDFDATAPLMSAQPMSEAVEKLKAAVEENDTPKARFALGMGQTLHAVEGLAQAWHRHGVVQTPAARSLPLFRIPVPDNPNPEAISVDKLDAIFTRFNEQIAEAEATLASIEAENLKLPVSVAMLRLDLDGDGTATQEESFGRIWAAINGQGRRRGGMGEAPLEGGQAQAADFYLALDAADVRWLQGYCHILMAATDLALAYDYSQLLHATGHLVFPIVEDNPTFLKENTPGRGGWVDDDFFDAIAFVHLLSFPVRDADRLASALDHLEQVPRLSGHSWQLILAEEDDDHEWIPSPTQTPVLGEDFRVTQEQVQEWLRLLNEVDAVLAGEKLIPFWRGNDPGRGVNLRRVFTEPTRFDLVLWVQGSAAAPYLEEGPLTTPDFWNDMNRAFRGNLIGFAVWFN